MTRPSLFWTHDLPVTLGAVVLLFVGWTVHPGMTAPALASFHGEGLSFRYPKGWYPREEAPGHWWYESTDDLAQRIEVRVEAAPRLFASIATAIEFERTTQAGGFYKRLERRDLDLGGRTWIRTRFSYAFKVDDDAAPAIATGIEYACLNDDRLYVVTVHGSDAEVEEMERTYLRTLKLAGRSEGRR